MKELSMNMLAPAKINLALAITDKRPDGYHGLETIFQTVALYDRVNVAFKGKGISCFCGELSGNINLAYQAARTFLEVYEAMGFGHIPGVEITIEKQIPMQAGLAGGSSDAATVLIAINQLAGNPLTYEQLLECAKKCGSDTAYCLRGGTQWGEGTGTILEELPPAPEMDILLVKPRQGVSTAEAYRLFDDQGRFANLEKDVWFDVLRSADVPRIGQLLANNLESAVFKLVPEISTLKALLLEGGCMGALMSGSGSAVFGIIKDVEQGEKMRRILLDEGFNHHWLVKTIRARNI
ncbi:4-(cytidine 5'-diphospho)-2-C-methyl-D-erythritol kinase [Dehalobacter sp. DCM]|uniref:4-(cytidine 5'-diphospho)-2-C-methyl-D-erythritol kinase n=1 Tax=Dehalobacter sp. DCM TaxID=2907827 RepID=UPI003081D391|nr:4-(cytidine 5'-diphospho)-2-C-methyl-D-erythritol kinase [Dehalobacter sp. DCM]